MNDRVYSAVGKDTRIPCRQGGWRCCKYGSVVTLQVYDLARKKGSAVCTTWLYAGKHGKHGPGARQDCVCCI